MRFREQTIYAPEENDSTAGYIHYRGLHCDSKYKQKIILVSNTRPLKFISAPGFVCKRFLAFFPIPPRSFTRARPSRHLSRGQSLLLNRIETLDYE